MFQTPFQPVFQQEHQGTREFHLHQQDWQLFPILCLMPGPRDQKFETKIWVSILTSWWKKRWYKKWLGIFFIANLLCLLRRWAIFFSETWGFAWRYRECRLFWWNPLGQDHCPLGSNYLVSVPNLDSSFAPTSLTLTLWSQNLKGNPFF